MLFLSSLYNLLIDAYIFQTGVDAFQIEQNMLILGVSSLFPMDLANKQTQNKTKTNQNKLKQTKQKQVNKLHENAFCEAQDIFSWSDAQW